MRIDLFANVLFVSGCLVTFLSVLPGTAADNPGKWPLVKADHPIGQWNTMAIKMAGTRVWVTLNGKDVVSGQVLDNYFDRAQPVLPTGSLELQTHGSEVRFRNIYVREIGE